MYYVAFAHTCNSGSSVDMSLPLQDYVIGLILHDASWGHANISCPID